MILGQANDETAATAISNTTAGDDVLTLAAAGNGFGLHATADSEAAVFGNSGTGAG